MWPFKKRQVEYVHSVYNGLVAEIGEGDVSALTLHIPTALHQAYQTKILLQRELIALAAISENAVADHELEKVVHVFADLIVSKCAERGLQLSRDQLAEYAFHVSRTCGAIRSSGRSNGLPNSVITRTIATWWRCSRTIAC